MNRAINSILGCLGLILSGCMHTVVSGGSEGAWSPGDGRYHVAIAAHGASGRAYTELTDKRVQLSIIAVDRQNQASTLFRHDFRMRAGRLDWRVHWQGTQSVQVTFRDERGLVASHALVYDSATNTFRERPTSGAR